MANGTEQYRRTPPRRPLVGRSREELEERGAVEIGPVPGRPGVWQGYNRPKVPRGRKRGPTTPAAPVSAPSRRVRPSVPSKPAPPTLDPSLAHLPPLQEWRLFTRDRSLHETEGDAQAYAEAHEWVGVVSVAVRLLPARVPPPGADGVRRLPPPEDRKSYRPPSSPPAGA